jgi:hypothetical protein
MDPPNSPLDAVGHPAEIDFLEDDWLAGLPMMESETADEVYSNQVPVTSNHYETCNLHVYSGKRSADEHEQDDVSTDVWSTGPSLHTAKMQRHDGDEEVLLVSELDEALPQHDQMDAGGKQRDGNAGAGSHGEHVSAKWVTELVESIGVITPADEAEWSDYLCKQYGVISGSKKPRRGAVCKIILMERVLRALSGVPCQDTRIVEKSALVQPDIIPGEEHGVTRFLRPGRNFTVNDPLAFNKTFRALQASHPSWPRVRPSDGTKGITQPLSALGLGPIDSAPWDVRSLHLRGPEDTDPEKIWCAKKQWWVSVNGKRDGLYYHRYEFDEKRVAKRSLAAHVFEVVPREESSIIAVP